LDNTNIHELCHKNNQGLLSSAIHRKAAAEPEELAAKSSERRGRSEALDLDFQRDIGHGECSGKWNAEGRRLQEP